MAPVWPVIPQDLADDVAEQLAGIATDLEQIRGRCAGYSEAPGAELLRAAALVDQAREWFADEACEKSPAERVFAVLPRDARDAAMVAAIARAANVSPSTARRHLQVLVDAGRACTVWADRRRATCYYRDPLAGERTTNGA
jgi:DNA-binding transcriptional ArsR family regulator